MDNAAETIQAAFRGFSVRRCQPLGKLRLIADVRSKLKKLEMRASDPIYIDKLCIDPMENRKMKEEIMALLLELDAIQGVLPVVRKIRKSVARDVVQFQEIVDAVKVDTAPRNDAEEVDPRPSGQASYRASEQANPRASAPMNPPLRRVMSLDDNVYPEQSYAHRGNKKKPSDGTTGDNSNRSSDEDSTTRRRPEGWVKSPLLQRSMSGNHRTPANKSPMLARTFSEVPRNAGVWNPLLGRSISEVVRKPANKSPLLGRSISEVQRKKADAVNSTPATSVPDNHRSSYPKTPPISDARGSSVDANSPPARHKVTSFNREEAAVLIQSTFRGHLSRRSRPLQHLRNISVVNTRLKELNGQLTDLACVERLRNDEMERLKWSEEITALLLKLDSVQGVVQTIRDIRKSVTREVIKLQEKVDSIIHDDDNLSRIAGIESDSSVASTEQLEFGPQVSDQESVDDDRGEQAVDCSPNASASMNATVGSRDALVQQDCRLWDDKFMDLRKPFNFEQGFDGSTASSPCEKGNSEGDLQPEHARVRKRVPSVSVESRYTESQDAFEIQQSDILSSGRFPTEDGRSLIQSSSVSAAGAGTGDMQQPLLLNVKVNRQHHTTTHTQKKLKRNEKERVQNDIITDAVSPDLDTSAAGQQVNTNGCAEKSVKAFPEGITKAAEAPLAGVSAGMGYEPQRPAYSTSVPSMRTSDECPSSERQFDGDSNDVVMLPDKEFDSDTGQPGNHKRRSPPRVPSCGEHLPEERACEFLRSRVGHCTTGEIAQGNYMPTTSAAPAVHTPSEDQWEVARVTALEDENARLKVLLSQVLEHAEDQAEDLKATKRRLAILEKERLQYTKKDDTGVRKKPTLVRRRR